MQREFRRLRENALPLPPGRMFPIKFGGGEEIKNPDGSHPQDIILTGELPDAVGYLELEQGGEDL